MRHLMISLVMAAMMLSGYAVAAVTPEQPKLSMDSMTVAQLEAAGDSMKTDSKYPEPVNNIGAIEYMQKRFGAAAKYFKKAVALDETKATFHVNLGATWFAQKKLERAFAEYARALELNPDALNTSNSGVQAQIASPEERAKYAYMLAKIYAKRGEYDECMRSLRKAKEDGYKELASVYKDAEFAPLRNDPRLAEIAGEPSK